MKRLILVLVLMCLASTAFAGKIISPSKFTGLYFSPLSYAFVTDHKPDPQWGAGVNYEVGMILGMPSALKFGYAKPYDRGDVHYGSASLVFYFN